MAVTRHQYRIYIKAPIEHVWNALLDPAFTRRYFHGTAFENAPVEGQPYRTATVDGSPAVDGTIEVLDPPHRLVQTWHTLYAPDLAAEPASRVEWTLTVAGDGLTQLDLIHGDLALSPLTWATVKHGWVWILDGLKTLIETGETLPAAIDTASHAGEGPDVNPEGDWHRAQGVQCNNSIWELVGKSDRTPADYEEMLRRAYSSAYHWQRATGTGPANEVRALYMLSKVHQLAGMPARALHYADAGMAQCAEHGLVDFDLAYAHEARARALLELGREDEGLSEWAAAKAVPIADPEDQAVVDGDFADAP